MLFCATYQRYWVVQIAPVNVQPMVLKLETGYEITTVAVLRQWERVVAMILQKTTIAKGSVIAICDADLSPINPSTSQPSRAVGGFRVLLGSGS
jgi:hypothetical protein